MNIPPPPGWARSLPVGHQAELQQCLARVCCRSTESGLRHRCFQWVGFRRLAGGPLPCCVPAPSQHAAEKEPSPVASGPPTSCPFATSHWRRPTSGMPPIRGCRRLRCGVRPRLWTIPPSSDPKPRTLAPCPVMLGGRPQPQKQRGFLAGPCAIILTAGWIILCPATAGPATD